MKGFFIGILVVIIMIVLLLLGGVIDFGLNTTSKSIEMSGEIVDATLDGNNAIYNYEWFKRQYESIEALKEKYTVADTRLNNLLDMLPEDRKEWDKEDKKEYSRIQDVLMATQNQLIDAVAEYDARSKMANRNIFKNNLPVNIFDSLGTGFEFVLQNH